MLILPHSIALVTTYQCSAACDHCCFACSPKKNERLTKEVMLQIINEAKSIPTVKVIVFTGGECFLLGNELDECIAQASSSGLLTRCVTNGYWASTFETAKKRLASLVECGLNEINISSGENHEKYVPISNVINAALAGVELGLEPLITVEAFEDTRLNLDLFMKDEKFSQYVKEGKIKVQRNLWIESDGNRKISHSEKYSRFSKENVSGCKTLLSVMTVTPDLDVHACCGLHVKKIDELCLGSLREGTLAEIIAKARNDLIQMWIHVNGPESLLLFVKEYLPNYELPKHFVHACETCLHIYKDQLVKQIIMEHKDEIEERILPKYIAALSLGVMTSISV